MMSPCGAGLLLLVAGLFLIGGALGADESAGWRVAYALMGMPAIVFGALLCLGIPF